MSNNISRETHRWSRIKEALKEGLSPRQKIHFDILAENIRRDLAQRNKSMFMENAQAGSISTTNMSSGVLNFLLPIFRRIHGRVIHPELVGIQPMKGPEGMLAFLRFNYATDSAGSGVRAGDELGAPKHVNAIAAAYSGNENDDTPDAGGTSLLEAVPGNQVTMEVKKQVVVSKTRKLSATWTPEADTDAANVYNLNIQTEMTTVLASEITQEVDQTIIRSLRRLCPKPTAANTFDFATVSGNHVSYVDMCAGIMPLIFRACNQVAVKTRRGQANRMVISPTLFTILESGAGSAFVRTIDGELDAPTNTQLVGTLNGRLKVYVDSFAEDDTPLFVIYKGESEVDAAAFYAPYVPLTMYGPVMDPQTFEHRCSMVDRSAYIEMTDRNISLAQSPDYVACVGLNKQTLKYF